MRLATIRRDGPSGSARCHTNAAVETGDADGVPYLSGDWAGLPFWRPPFASAGRVTTPRRAVPEKIVCVGLNYRDHVLEMGNELPEYPTLFAKYAPSLVGAHDDIVLPRVSEKVDWEAELAVVIGRPVRHAGPDEALAAIAGYAVLNDVSMRDWQNRTKSSAGRTSNSTPLARGWPHPTRLPPAAGISTSSRWTVQRSTTD